MRVQTLCILALLPVAEASSEDAVFPARMPSERPDHPASAAIARLYERWNPHEDRGNELVSNFKYTPIEGLPAGPGISRRDPTKVLKIDGVYHVWYTRRATEHPPAGPDQATDSIPSFDWDLCEIWHATSKDGFTWKEEGAAVKRQPHPGYGWRSVSTPDILSWNGKFYLYYQGFNEIPGKRGDRAATTVAVADSVWGPWEPLGQPVVGFGAPEDWDSNAIHDPCPVVFKGRIYLYYKGSPGKGGRDGTLVRAQGVAMANHPAGPFTKSPLNPVINSGHETCIFPWQDGLAAIVSLDGPEKNTVQFSPDGIHWEVKSLIQMPPVAPGPFVPDAFVGNRNGRGITWGLCHIMDRKAGQSVLARFDCDLSRDVDRPFFKRNNLRFNAATYVQPGVGLPQGWRTRIDRENAGEAPTQEAPPPSLEAPGDASAGDRPFPAVLPLEKPDRSLSAAMERLYDVWNPHEDRGNELYSNFRYSSLQGLEESLQISRRDPTKVINVDGVYHVWYTSRRTAETPEGLKLATATKPGTDWDLADIWHATSANGWDWVEDEGPRGAPAARSGTRLPVHLHTRDPDLEGQVLPLFPGLQPHGRRAGPLPGARGPC